MMEADDNTNFEYGGGFPQSFSNRDAVCLPATVNRAMGMPSGRGMCSSGSSMAGMFLPANAGTLNNTSPVTPQSGNSSGNAILNHESPPESASTSAVNWSNDEVLVLRRGLEEYADKPSLTKYINIAGMLPNKTARDIALRCHWMMPEKMVNSSSVSSMNYVQPDNVTHNAPTMLDVHHAYPTESETQRCLAENVKLLNLIMANFEMNKLQWCIKRYESDASIMHVNRFMRLVAVTERKSKDEVDMLLHCGDLICLFTRFLFGLVNMNGGGEDFSLLDFCTLQRS
nr:PREDICTED: uncharacterized protein LOC103990722 isoform X3 [Musa acuminata subsp. malaccensis]